MLKGYQLFFPFFPSPSIIKLFLQKNFHFTFKVSHSVLVNGYICFRVLSSHGGLVEQNTSFHTVRTLLSRLLDLDTWKTVHDKEEALLKRIGNEDLMDRLPLLNSILNLNVSN